VKQSRDSVDPGARRGCARGPPDLASEAQRTRWRSEFAASRWSRPLRLRPSALLQLDRRGERPVRAQSGNCISSRQCPLALQTSGPSAADRFNKQRTCCVLSLAHPLQNSRQLPFGVLSRPTLPAASACPLPPTPASRSRCAPTARKSRRALLRLNLQVLLGHRDPQLQHRFVVIGRAVQTVVDGHAA
jgi:hypothetical protein